MWLGPCWVEALSTGSLGLSWLPGICWSPSVLMALPCGDGVCEAMVLYVLEVDLPHTATHLWFGPCLGKCPVHIGFVLAMRFYADFMPIRKEEKKPDLA